MSPPSSRNDNTKTVTHTMDGLQSCDSEGGCPIPPRFISSANILQLLDRTKLNLGQHRPFLDVHVGRAVVSDPEVVCSGADLMLNLLGMQLALWPKRWNRQEQPSELAESNQKGPFHWRV